MLRRISHPGIVNGIEETIRPNRPEVNNPTMIENMTGKPFKLSTHDSGKGIRAYAAQEIIGQITTRQKMEPSQVALFKEIARDCEVPAFAGTTVRDSKALECKVGTHSQPMYGWLDHIKRAIGSWAQWGVVVAPRESGWGDWGRGFSDAAPTEHRRTGRCALSGLAATMLRDPSAR